VTVQIEFAGPFALRGRIVRGPVVPGRVAAPTS
jgi:hypothetical protein